MTSAFVVVSSGFSVLTSANELPWQNFEPDNGMLPTLEHDCAKLAFSLGPDAKIMDDDCATQYASVCQTTALCEPGNYRVGTMCRECPAGKYNPTRTTSGGACRNCPAGRYGTTAGESNSDCTGQCALGHYCPGGQSAPDSIKCPAGRYGASFGLATNSCSGKCNAGFYCELGESSPTPPGKLCAAGRYGNAGATAVSCSGPCEPGYFCHAGSPSRSQYRCEKDPLNPMATVQCPDPLNPTAQIDCPDSQFCPRGSAEPTPVSSFFATYTGGVGIRHNQGACERGRWCPNGERRLCAAGRYGLGANMYTNDYCEGPCVQGYQCPAGSHSPTPFECGRDAATGILYPNPRNYYCPEGSGESLPVPDDHYSTPSSGAATTRTGAALCIRDRACVDGIMDYKVEFSTGCSSWDSGTTTGDRRWTGEAVFEENSDLETASVSVWIRPPYQIVVWTVEAECEVWSSQVTPDMSVDFSSLFEVVVSIPSTTSNFQVLATATVRVASGKHLNFEVCEKFSTRVVATIDDPDEDVYKIQTFTCRLELSVQDTNDAPYFPGELGVTTYVRFTPEAIRANTPVGEPINAEDEDIGQEHTYSITSGNYGNMFGITRCGGQLFSMNGDLDFEGTPAYNLTITVADSGEKIGGSFTAETIATVFLTNVNERPTFNTSQDLWFLAENLPVGTMLEPVAVDATDPDGDDLMLTVQVVDGNQLVPAFRVQNGSLHLFSNVVLDFEQKDFFRLILTVNDGEFETFLDATVEVIDMNDPPVFVREFYNYDVLEDTIQELAGENLMATDPDAAGSISMGIDKGNSDLAFRLIPNSDSYTLALNKTLDYEAIGGEYRAEVQADSTTKVYRPLLISASDGQVTITVPVNVTIRNINEKPTLADNLVVYVDEELPVGLVTGVPLNVSDPEQHFQSFFWTIDSPGTIPFALEPSSGRLRILNRMDFEATTGPLVCTITVRDNGAPPLSDSSELSVYLNDVNEAPQFDGTQTFFVAENPRPRAIVGTANAFDPDAGDAGMLQFLKCTAGGSTTTTNRWDLFDLMANGTITVHANVSIQSVWQSPLDFEGAREFVLCLKVLDKGNGQGSPLSRQVLGKVVLTDVPEPPIFFQNSYDVGVNDGSGAGVNVGSPLQAKDQDAGSVLTFSVSNGSTALFDISTAGQVFTVSPVPTLSVEMIEYEYTITVEDQTGLSSEVALAIRVTNANQPPQMQPIGPQEVLEHSVSGSIICQASAVDPDPGHEVIFSLSVVPAAAAGAIQIDSSTGIIEVSDSLILDRELIFPYQPWTVTVSARDFSNKTGHASLENRTSFTLEVTNLNEAPAISNVALPVLENTVGSTGAFISAVDVDVGDSLTYTIDEEPDGFAGTFRVEASTGEIFINAGKALNYETFFQFTSGPAEISIKIKATDGLGMTDVAQARITVLDANEQPTLLPSTGYILEGRTGVPVMQFSAGKNLSLVFNDPDLQSVDNGKVSLAVVAVYPGAPLTLFSIGGNRFSNFTLNVAQSLDFEDVLQWKVSVRVTDKGVPAMSAITNYTVIVGDVDDATLTGAIELVDQNNLSVLRPSTSGGHLVRLKGSNLGFSNRRIAASGGSPGVYARYTFDTHGAGSLPGVTTACAALDTDDTQDMVVECVSPPGIGTASIRLQVASITEGLDYEIPTARTFQFAGPTVTSVSFGQMELLGTAGGEEVTIYGSNFGPHYYVLPPFPVQYSVPQTGSTLRFAQNCTIQSAHAIITCKSAPGVGMNLQWWTSLAGEESNKAPTAGYAPPELLQLSAVDGQGTSLAGLAGQGGDEIRISGRNLGNAGVQMLYKNVSGRFRYKSTQCTFEELHQIVVCRSIPGSGLNHQVHLAIGSNFDGWRVSRSTSPDLTVSYAPPVISLGGVSGPGSARADTRGGQVITVLGANLGSITPIDGVPICGAPMDPLFAKHSLDDNSLASFTHDEVPVLVYGPEHDPSKYNASNCIVLDQQSSVMECCSSEGTGANFVFQIRVDGQISDEYSSQILSTGYHPPVVQQLDPSDAAQLSDGGGWVSILGDYFGSQSSGIEEVLYGQGNVNGTYEFEASQCFVSPEHLHSKIICLTDEQAGTGLSWSVKIDGQMSQIAKTNYAPPQVLDFASSSEFSTRGGELVGIYGINFGPGSNESIFFETARYGKSGQEYTAQGCVVASHSLIHCTTVPGAGSGLRWTVRVGKQTSALSVQTWAYKAPTIQTIIPSRDLPTNGNMDLAILGSDFAVFDAQTEAQVIFKPQLGEQVTKTVIYGGAMNSSLDNLQLDFVGGWGLRCQVRVQLLTKGTDDVVATAAPFSIDYGQPRVFSIDIKEPTKGQEYTVTLTGQNFGATSFFKNESQPAGFVALQSLGGAAPKLSFCKHGTSTMGGCTNVNAPSNTSSSDCVCTLKLLEWGHSQIRFETTATSGNVSVSTFMQFGASGEFQYFTTEPIAFESTSPRLAEAQKTELESLRFSTEGGDQLEFKMLQIQAEVSLLRVYAGYAQILPLGDHTSCIQRPCLVERASRACAVISISNCQRTKDAAQGGFSETECLVKCVMPPGQGIVQMHATYAGKPSIDANMPKLVYSRPELEDIKQVGDTHTALKAVVTRLASGSESTGWSIQLPTAGACFIVTGKNFGDAKYWSFSADGCTTACAPAPYDFRRGSLPDGTGLHISSPYGIVDRRNTRSASLCFSPVTQRGTLGPVDVHLYTGVGYNVSETLEDYQNAFRISKSRYSQEKFFGSEASSAEVLVVSVQKPFVEPTTTISPTRGGVVLRLKGQNFGASSDTDFLPRVSIGDCGLPCICELVSGSAGIQKYPREQLSPSSLDSPHEVITCIVPPGTGLNKSITLKVGGHTISNMWGSGMSGVVFNYEAPALYSVSRNNGPTVGGYKMTLNGTNFGNDADKIKVHFIARTRMTSDSTPHYQRAIDTNSIAQPAPQSFKLVSHESLEINVPPGQGAIKQIVVEVDKQWSLNMASAAAPRVQADWPLNPAASFLYDPPKIFGVRFDAPCSTIGCTVQIIGENFGQQVAAEMPSGLQPELRSRYHNDGGQSYIQLVEIETLPVSRICLTNQGAHGHTIISCQIDEGVGQGRNITVQLGELSATEPLFSYAAPVITDIVPNVANAAGGRTLRITGANFGPIYENKSFENDPDWAGKVRNTSWAPPVSILFSNVTCEDAVVAHAHAEAQCTFGETYVGPAMLAMDVAGVPLRQSSRSLGGLLQFTCERGFYGQVGELCSPCPTGAVCDFNGRYDCAVADSVLCIGADCDWYENKFCRGNLDCPQVTTDTNGTVRRAIEYDNRVCVEYPEPISDAAFWREDKPNSNMLCDPLRLDRPPPYTGTCPAFLKCEPADACIGNNTCAAGYTDDRCAKCAEKYYRFDGECKACPDRAWLPVVMFVCGIMFIGAFGFWLNRKNINLALMSISVDYVQVLGLFARSKIEWPKILKDLFSYMSFFNFNLDLTAPECLAPSIDYRLKWIGTMVLPIAVFVLLLAVYLSGNLYLRHVRRLSKRQRTAHKAPTVGAGLTLSYFMYLYVSRTVLDVFNCSPTDPPDDWEPGYMQADFIPCYKEGGTHLQLLPFAAVFLVVYVMAYPAAIYAWLRRNRHIVKVDQLLRAYGHGHDEKTSDRVHYQFRRMFHKVYYHFKPDKWYWISVIISRKFLIAITALLFRSTPGYQLAMIVLVLFASYSVHIRSSPFMSRPEHRAITLAHEKKVEESDPFHLQLDAALQPLLQKAQRADRSEFRQATFRAEQKRGAALDDSQLMTNYNTVETVLLVSAILVALSGIMFNSKKMVEMDTSPAKDALTMLVLTIILASIAYFVVIFVVEIVETIGDDPFCCCHCVPAEPRRRMCCVLCGSCQLGYRAIRWTHDKYLMSQKRQVGVHELEEIIGGKNYKKRRGTDSHMNPMAALSLMQSSSKDISSKEEARAMEIIAGARPPTQADWLVAQQFLTARQKQVDSDLPEQIKLAKRGVRSVDANTFAKSVDASILRQKGGRRQFSQKVRAASNPKLKAGGRRGVAAASRSGSKGKSTRSSITSL